MLSPRLHTAEEGEVPVEPGTRVYSELQDPAGLVQENGRRQGENMKENLFLPIFYVFFVISRSKY